MNRHQIIKALKQAFKAKRKLGKQIIRKLRSIEQMNVAIAETKKLLVVQGGSK